MVDFIAPEQSSPLIERARSRRARVFLSVRQMSLLKRGLCRRGMRLACTPSGGRIVHRFLFDLAFVAHSDSW